MGKNGDQAWLGMHKQEEMLYRHHNYASLLAIEKFNKSYCVGSIEKTVVIVYVQKQLHVLSK